MNLNRFNCKSELRGPRNSVLLAMWHTGIGDAIHALPVVSEMIRDGYDVTVNCKPFTRPFWQNVGITTMSVREPIVGLSETRFDVVYSLNNWGLWDAIEHGTECYDRIDWFGKIVGVAAPKTFDWYDYLQPKPRSGKPYVLYAPESTESWRTVPDTKAREIFEAFDTDVVWLSQGSRAGTDEQWRAIPEAMRMPIKTLRDLQRSEEDRIRDCTILTSFEELLNCVYGASHVVASESAVATLAAALGKPLTVLYGLSGHEHTIGQFRRYNSTWSYEAITGESNGCKKPCYRMEYRGFSNNTCGGNTDYPVCLATLNTTEVLHSITLEQE